MNLTIQNIINENLCERNLLAEPHLTKFIN